jgi:hypothetical protein
MQGFWSGDGLIHLKNGTIARTDITETWSEQPLMMLDELIRLTDVSLSPGSYDALAAFANNSPRWDRVDLFHLMLFTPELQVA